MTDTATALTRIRELAQEGCDEDNTYDDTIRFKKILHNLNQLEDAMDTDTTDDAQRWIVTFDTAHEWGVVEAARDATACVNAIHYRSGDWSFYATVHCPRAEAEQAAVDAWAEAGFAHAPKEPPRPTRVEVTYWAALPYGKMLDRAIEQEPYPTSEAASNVAGQFAAKDYRIVKVEAVVSEVSE